LRSRVEDLVGSYEKASKAICGVSAVDLRNGRRLVGIRPDRPFVPASNQKILTCAFALDELPEDFEFTTSVYRLGRDILVVGDGDPTVGDPILAKETSQSIYAELDRWARAVKENTGSRIDGDLLVCSSFPLSSFRHGDWDKAQHHRWYCAPVAGLNFHNNCFAVTFSLSKGRVRPNVTPDGRFIRILNHLKSGPRSIWSLQSNVDDSVIHLRGKVEKATKTPLRSAVNNPPVFTGRVFADRLGRAGVALGGTIQAVETAEVDLTAAKLLIQTKSPLKVAMRRANKRSLNMAAECIFLAAGGGTWERSADQMTDFLIRTCGVPRTSIEIRDGSGLSRKNRVAPYPMCRVLSHLALHPGAMAFLETLPRSGTDGSMRKRLTRPPYCGRILAKTGYVSGASCLSGYVLDRGHRVTVGFSILVGKVKPGQAWVAKKLQDAVCRALLDWVDASDPTGTDERAQSARSRLTSQPG